MKIFIACLTIVLVSCKNENAKVETKTDTPKTDTVKNIVTDTVASKSINNPNDIKVPDFTANDVNGNAVTLSNFYKGKKLVLIDFWASWCGPCRKENPNVVKAYNKFHNKGFNIIGVSLDRNAEDWKQAISEDGLNWQHVSELKQWNSEIAKLYGVEGIPTNFLIDGNGKLLATELRGKELDKKLNELLK